MTSRTRYNFDAIQPVNRATRNKYAAFKPDTLVAWVADMDLPVADEIMAALRERLETPNFGYATELSDLREIICERLQRNCRWTIQPEHIVFEAGVISGYNVGLRVRGKPGGRFLTQSPAYPPFLSATGGSNQKVKTVEMICQQEGNFLRYEPDIAAFEAAIDSTVHSFLHCNPHNPSGRMWTAEEQARLAEVCIKHDLLILSDEIHCDLCLDDTQHIPMAAIAPEIADHTITYMSASKGFNLASLKESIAIIPNDSLRQRYIAARQGVGGDINELGMTAMRAAYLHGDNWLWQLQDYLKGNRDFTIQHVVQHMPGVRMTRLEATYLQWLDMRDVMPSDVPAIQRHELVDDVSDYWLTRAQREIDPFFLRHAGVALNSGVPFLGPGFVRLNLAQPRPQLEQILNRMVQALAGTAQV